MRSWIISAFAFFCGLAISGAIALKQRDGNLRIAEEALQHKSNLLAEDLRDALVSYGSGLIAARDYFSGVAAVDRKSFGHFAALHDIDKEFPGAESLGFIRYIPRQELAAHVDRRRRSDAPDFSPRTIGVNTSAAMLVDFAAPKASEGELIGLDIGSESNWREAAARSMWSGEAAISQPLPNDSHAHALDFAYLLPIYRQDKAATTPQERADAIFGWAFMQINLSSVLDKLDAKTVEFRLFDLVVDEEPRLMFSNRNVASPAKEIRLARQYELALGGRSLRFEVIETPEFRAGLNLDSPWLTVTGGSVASLLLAFVIWLLMETERRAEAKAERMSRKARDSELRFRDFSASASDWYWETDAEMRIVFVSDNFEAVYGAKPEEILGKTRYEMLSSGSGISQDEIQAHIAVLKSHQPFRNFEYFRLTKSGTPRWVSLSGVPHFDAEGKFMGYRGTGQVITERKEQAIRLMEAKEAAEAASRAKSEFLSSMSHELRTPLNAILGFSQLFGMDETLPAETRSLAKEIERAGQHLLTLVNDVIELASFDAGNLRIQREAIPLKTALSSYPGLMTSLAERFGVTVNLHLDIDDKLRISADPARLRQAVTILLSNAIKYNHPQGHARLEASCRGDRVRICVVDTGSGISPEQQSRLFAPFDRLSHQGGAIEGAGIGLVIAKRLVEAMDGTIGFQSTAGAGSSFWLEFPIAFETV